MRTHRLLGLVLVAMAHSSVLSLPVPLEALVPGLAAAVETGTPQARPGGRLLAVGA